MRWLVLLLVGCGGTKGRPWVLCRGGAITCEKRCTLDCWGDPDAGTQHIVTLDPSCRCTWATR